MTCKGPSPHNILARASCWAWVRVVWPGSNPEPPRPAPVDDGLGVALGGKATRSGPGPAATGTVVALATTVSESGTSMLCAIMAFAAAVPSAPQEGQATGDGTRPFTGSTSNAYRCPHSQSIFTGMVTAFRLEFNDQSFKVQSSK